MTPTNPARRAALMLGLVPLLISWSASAQSLPPAYRITDIGDLGGGHTIAYDINDAGVITGMSTRKDGDHMGVAFLYADGRMRGLRFNTAGRPSYGVSINASNVVAGFDSGNLVLSHATAWSWEHGKRRYYLKTPPSHDAFPIAINDAGAIVANVEGRAQVYYSGRTIELEVLPGYNRNFALAINNAGDVVGNQAVDSTHQHSFLYSKGAMVVFDVLGSAYHEATGINDQGQICGTYLQRKVGTDFRVDRAYLWQRGSVVDLGSLAGVDGSSQALAINNAGVVVGDSDWGPGKRGRHAFVYADGAMHDLNDLIDGDAGDWVLRDAVSINGPGQIIGRGKLNGVDRAYLATPVAR